MADMLATDHDAWCFLWRWRTIGLLKNWRSGHRRARVQNSTDLKPAAGDDGLRGWMPLGWNESKVLTPKYYSKLYSKTWTLGNYIPYLHFVQVTNIQFKIHFNRIFEFLVLNFIGCAFRTKTMHRFLCFCSCKFPNYFATLGCYLFMLFLIQFKDEGSV